MPDAPAARRYTAFISYRHADNKEAGRRWAEWIHQQLETYHVPRELVGKQGLRGEPIPATLYPVFRDEEELPADADLSQNLRRALENAATLVVICSPRAVSSRFVDQEIRVFKELGKADRILALLVDGEPNADQAAPPGAGAAPPLECLPAALRFGVRTDAGTIDWSQRTEPIAADARPGGLPEHGFTSPGAYGEALRKKGGLPGREIHRLQREYAGRLELARLKVVAGVLGVPLGQLRARDAVYRAKRFRRLATVLGSLASVALVAAVVAVWQGQRAERNYERAEAARLAQERQVIEASRHAHAAAERELRAGHWQEGVTWLGRALRYHPENRPAAAHLWSVIAYGQGDRDEPPLEAWAFDGAVERLAASPDGKHIAVVTAAGRLVLHELATGRRRSAALPPLPVHGMRFDAEGRHLLLRVGTLEMLIAAWSPAGADLSVVKLDGTFHDAALSRDGRTVLAAGVVHGIERLDPATGRHEVPLGPPFQEHEQQQVGALFTPEGTLVLVHPRKGARFLLDLASGERRNVPEVPVLAMLSDARLSPRATYLAQKAGKRLTVYEMTGGRAVLTVPESVDPWSGFAFSPDADAVVLRRDEGTLEVRSLPDGKALAPSIRHAASALRAIFAGDGRRVLTGGDDGWVAAWARPGAAGAGATRLTPGPAASVHWLWSGRALVLGETGVDIWDVGARKPVGRLETGKLPGGVAAARDGSWIATGGPGGLVTVWNPATLQPVREVQALPLEVYSLAAAHGPWLIASGIDLTDGKLVPRVLVLDVVAGKAIGSEVHPPLSHILALSADGGRLLCCSGLRKTWSAWRVADGTALAAVAPSDLQAVQAEDERAGIGLLNATTSTILDFTTRLPQTEPFPGKGAAQWSRDGQRLLTLDAEGAVLLYETPLPGPPGAWMDDLVSAASGLKVGDTGLLKPLTVEERQAARARLASASIDDPLWSRLVRWWLRPPAERAGGP